MSFSNNARIKLSINFVNLYFLGDFIVLEGYAAKSWQF